MVTGSADGIGKEYAKNLAQRGINIVLIDRNESKLIDVSKEIGICQIVFKYKSNYLGINQLEKRQCTSPMCRFSVESAYAVQTKYIVADFSHGKDIYDRIEQQLQEFSIPIGILGKTFIHWIKCSRLFKDKHIFV